MDPGADDDITRLLQRIGAGDASAANQLMPLVLAQLRALAARHLEDQRPGHTLQPTALVNEAYLRLVRQRGGIWEGRSAFLAMASRAMRSILVDHARARAAAKRSGGRRVPLADTLVEFDARSVDMLALEEALTELEAFDGELARIVDLLFFGGLTAAEASDVVGKSSRTVERGWRTARAWLATRLAPDGPA